MTVTYQITLTAEQAELVRNALEACARMGIGQIEDALTFYPAVEFRPPGWHEAMGQIESIMQTFRKPCSLKSDTHRRLWSMMTSIRHRIAWDKAIDRGAAQHDGDRSHAGMWMVYYDSPDPSDWPAIKIERVSHGAS